MGALTERELYRFDLEGAIVIPGILSDVEVEAANAALDANADRAHVMEDETFGAKALAGERRTAYDGMLTWDKPHCDPFRSMIAHPKVMPYLDDLLGAGWHLDHAPNVFEFTKGTEGHALHLGLWWNHPGIWFDTTSGRIRSGLLVVEYVLTDQIEGEGGFAFIPGSHKSAFPRPKSIDHYETDTDLVRNPSAPAGSVIIFTEKVAHGALPWVSGHDRRVAIFRYSPKTQQYGPGVHEVVFPSWVDDLTPEQRMAVEPAHFYGRPAVEDGKLTTVMADYDVPSTIPSGT